MARATSSAGNAGARSSGNSGNEQVQLNSRDVTRVVMVLVGITLIVASFLTPWWTRGFTVNYDEETTPRTAESAGIEGLYWSYSPFQTPGAGGVSVDGYREFATAALGIVLVLSALLLSAHLAIRWGMHTGRIETNHDLPVRFAIAAFWLGLTGILMAAFLLPVAGPNPGWLFGEESEGAAFDGPDGEEFLEAARFANVGFYLGLVAFVAYPAWLWADAARTRAVHALTAPTGRATGTAAY